MDDADAAEDSWTLASRSSKMSVVAGKNLSYDTHGKCGQCMGRVSILVEIVLGGWDRWRWLFWVVGFVDGCGWGLCVVDVSFITFWRNGVVVDVVNLW